MTRKDYERIARAIAKVRAEWDGDNYVLPAIDAMAGELAEECRQDNARFDRARFLKAAGVTRG